MRGSINSIGAAHSPRLGRIPPHPFQANRTSPSFNGLVLWYPLTAFSRTEVPVIDYAYKGRVRCDASLDPGESAPVWQAVGYGPYNKSNNRHGQYFKPWTDTADFRYEAAIPLPTTPGPFTILAWGLQNTNFVFGLDVDSGGPAQPFESIVSVQSTITWYIDDGSTSSFADSSGVFDTSSENQQYNPGGGMLAVVKASSADRSIYHNGDLLVNNTAIDKSPSGLVFFYFGHKTGHNANTFAAAYEFRVYNRALTQAEIRYAYYNRLNLYEPTGPGAMPIFHHVVAALAEDATDSEASGGASLRAGGTSKNFLPSFLGNF